MMNPTGMQYNTSQYSTTQF